ncbi:MAG: hypothetical protein GQ531_10345 [Sulfurovum sp.]|nr:hypothetical protein [Sulfurovum sp.]
MKHWTRFTVGLTLLLLLGCTQIPKNYPKEHSKAYASHKSTKVGKMFAKEAAKHPGKSGFDIIRYGKDAFASRIAMTHLAEKTLDLQYYLWERDETGRLLAKSVIEAADRGIKVRVLLDDIGLESRDTMLSSVNAHPNIQIRIFNPFEDRTFHNLNFLRDFDRVNHRMHNKTFIMDNTMVIVGGRNIGNHYFGVDDKMNFRDLDIAAAGPIVRDVSKVFDYFWNGSWSVPIEALEDKRITQADIKKSRAFMKKKIEQDFYPYPIESDSSKMEHELNKIRKKMIWAKGTFVWDDPVQMRLPPEEQRNTMIQKLHTKLKTVKHTLDIESPYFIPRTRGTKRLRDMVKRGVDVRILTNSQSSNDVAAAFAGYETYRKELVESGISLFELRPDAGGHKIINRKTIFSKAHTGLHAKTLVFDDKSLFVGSFNLDPRSSAINTEGGLYVESPKLAKRVLDFMEVGKKPENAYRLALDKKGDLVWLSTTKGKKEVAHSDPHTDVFDQIKVNVIQALPIEDQL